MKGTSGNKLLQVELNGKTNGNNLKQMGVAKRLKVASLNSHLICILCSGYFVEATAIVQCLHTFCRSCIVKYLQTNSFCPICDVQIHQAKPCSSLRSDKTLQDLVYKLVPGLYQDEMKRRRQFYSRLGAEIDVGEGEEGGFLPHGARFFSQDDSISLSLEYYRAQNEDEQEPPNKMGKQTNEKPKRYLQCPAAVTIRHLKKFLRMKYGIGLDCWVDIIYKDECLPENFSLIDVAYTFAWKRTSPMRFAYRILSKVTIRTLKPQRNFQSLQIDERETKKSKLEPTLEQQMQSEYLGNFNLNPTNSGICKPQNDSKSKNKCINDNNNVIRPKEKKSEYYFKTCQESEEGSQDKLIQSGDDSNASGLRIISEKEESLKGNSEDSRESIHLSEKKRKSVTSVPNFGEETLDSFSAKKLLKNKHKSEGKKRKLQGNLKEKRRKSTSHAEDYKEAKKKFPVAKRRKTIADEFSLKRERESKIFEDVSCPYDDEDCETLANLKNEALKKVFVTKEKPENSNKRKEIEVRKKKRKKSKHHEGEPKKKKLEAIPTSPSIMSFAKDALKLKVKLTPNKTVLKSTTETNEDSSNKEVDGDLDSVAAKLNENDNKKIVTDKERLLHLRAVRHKNIINKNNPKEYINAPPSLTISKVDSSEPQPVKSTLVESKPSLEITLVRPTNNSKVKIDKSPETRREPEPEKVRSPVNEFRHSEVVDHFGVLDLSEKSTRTKENSSNSSPAKEVPERPEVERCRKTTHQSIMQIAQNLVNRKLSPTFPKNNLKTGFNVGADPSAAAAAMRNLKTLSDTAVNILMAAQNKNFPIDSQKRKFSSPVSVTTQNSSSPPNSTKPSKDCENSSELKIPVYPISRERMHPIPPVPNLHEIYPRGKGRAVPASRPSTPVIKPGQNQTVRHIPNPFNVLHRQGNQTSHSVTPPSPQLKPESGEDSNPKPKLNPVPPLQLIQTKNSLPKLGDLPENNNEKNSNDFKPMLTPKTVNNNTKSVQNGSECSLFGLKNGEEKIGTVKLNSNSNPVRKMENMAKNIESVAAGLTARAVSNAMIDAK